MGFVFQNDFRRDDEVEFQMNSNIPGKGVLQSALTRNAWIHLVHFLFTQPRSASM